jgi:hypothetical protein
MSNEKMSADEVLATLHRAAGCVNPMNSPQHAEWHAELVQARKAVAALIAERDALREFARWTIAESSFCGLDIGGDDVQDKAEALGIIREVRVTEPCRESCACTESGFPTTCYRFAWALESEKP